MKDTLGAVATPAINPWLHTKMPYDPVHDFTPITLVAQVPKVLVMYADRATRLKVASLRELVADAKANPGRLNHGSGGNGSAGRLAGELFTTVSEAEAGALLGLGRVDSSTWFGLFGPARQPADETQRLNKTFVDTLQSPELKSRLAPWTAEPAPTTPELFAAFVKTEPAMYERAVKATGARAG